MTDPNQLAVAGTPEALNPFAATGAAMQRFVGRIGADIRSGYEAALDVPRDIKMYALAGTAAIALFAATHAEVAHADVEPFAADNVPGLSGAALPGAPEAGRLIVSPVAEARPVAGNSQIEIQPAAAAGDIQSFAGITTMTLASEAGPAVEARRGVFTQQSGEATAQASSLQQKCKPQILKPPHKEKIVMDHAGTFQQQILVQLGYGEVNKPNLDCSSWKRLGKIRAEIKKAGHWINLTSPLKWWPMLGGPKSNEAGVISSGFAATEHVFDECVNGHREPARVRARNFMQNVKGKIVGAGKIKTWPVEFNPKTNPPC